MGSSHPYQEMNMPKQMQNFRLLTGDVNWRDHGGKFYRRIEPQLYEVIEWARWSELVGEEDAPATYNAQRSIVGWGTHYDAPIAEALRSYGFEEDNEGIWSGGDLVAKRGALTFELVILEALHSYGAKDVEADLSSNNARTLWREIRS